MVKLHLPTGIAACLAAAVVISCGNAPKPVAPAGEPAAKSAHAGHDAAAVVTEELSTDREIMAAATKGDLWGYIDKSGAWVLPPRANSVGTWRRNESGRWEFARHHAAFTSANVFSGGLAAVSDQETGQYGYIDNRGQWVISPRGAVTGGYFSAGLAPGVDAATNKYGFIDKSGGWAIEAQFTGYPGPFREHVAPVWGESEEGVSGCGYINQSGGWFIEPEYSNCRAFYHGLAAVSVLRGGYDLWGYINVDNEWAIEPQFDRAGRFSDGLARVSLDIEHVAYINTSGQFVIGPEHQNYCGPICRFVDGLAAKRDLNGDWGYIDKSGAWVIEPQFARARAFSEGLAVATTPRGSHPVKYGYIDTSGEWVIEPVFAHALPFTRTTP